MKLKIAINGFGDIGRNILSAIYSNGNNEFFEIVAINDLIGPLAAVHALRYDEKLPSFEPTIGSLTDSIIIGRDKIPFFMEVDVSRLPWKKLGVDLAIECNPVNSMEQRALEHRLAGAQKVLTPSVSFNSKEHQLSKLDQYDYFNMDTMLRNNYRQFSGVEEAFEKTPNPYWDLANKTLIDAKSMERRAI